jgi:hypothetical protein
MLLREYDDDTIERMMMAHEQVEEEIKKSKLNYYYQATQDEMILLLGIFCAVMKEQDGRPIPYYSNFIQCRLLFRFNFIAQLACD